MGAGLKLETAGSRSNVASPVRGGRVEVAGLRRPRANARPTGIPGDALAGAYAVSDAMDRVDQPSPGAPSRSAEPQDPGEAVRVIRSLAELDALGPAWDAISTPWTSPMQGHDWVRIWAEVYGADRCLEVMAAGGPSVGAIAPLFRSGRAKSRLEFVGMELGEGIDFVYSDRFHIDALAKAIALSRMPVRFWRVPTDSPVVPALMRAYRWRGIVRTKPADGCPSIPLDDSWVNPEQHLDKRRRSNLRRASRIAEGMGKVTYEVVSPTPENVGPLLEEAYAVEASGWKARAGDPMAHHPLQGEFFRRYALACSQRGDLRLCFLRIDGRAAAMKLAVITGNRFWLVKMGYDEAFERCSPGALLLRETIQYAARSGLYSYEFLGADEPWVRIWTPRLRPCVSISTYPFSRPGALAIASGAVAAIDRRLRSGVDLAGRIPRAMRGRAAHPYVAGPNLEDALSVCRWLGTQGFRSTICYVDDKSDTPRAVAHEYEAAIDAIGGGEFDCYSSVKAPVLGFARDLFRRLVKRAQSKDVGLHFDSLAAEDADRTFALIEELRNLHGKIGCTLPGRWSRSVADAGRAVAMGLGVRVVKGEWSDVHGAKSDASAGVLAIVDRIAGRVPHAAVATHDPTLAYEAIRRLRSAGTHTELEVLMGYPLRRVIPVADAEGVPVRVYVPYGHPGLPYSMSHLKRNPRVAAWALRDLMRGPRSTLRGISTRPPTRREDRPTT